MKLRPVESVDQVSAFVDESVGTSLRAAVALCAKTVSLDLQLQVQFIDLRQSSCTNRKVIGFVMADI